MEKLDEIKREISKLELREKSVKYLLENHGYLYHRIYSYSKKEKEWLPKLFFDLGLINGRVDGVDSLEKLDAFMEIFSYKNKEWSTVKSAHKNLIKKTLGTLDIRQDIFLARYNMINKGRDVYKSIEEIKEDLTCKGLINSSPSSIRNFDQGKTLANIESFLNRNNLDFKQAWIALEIPYKKGLVAYEKGVKIDFVYHNEDEMIKDFKSKNLLQKTKREVWRYDCGKTVARVQRYATRQNLDVQSLWKILKVKDSPRKNKRVPSCNLHQLKNIFQERGLVGKTIKEVNLLDPDLCLQVKNLARTGVSMSDIWKNVGVLREQGFDSMEEIVSKIQKSGYKTAKDVRGDWKFYKRISGFVKRNAITTKEIWEKAGIAYSKEGRPSKVRKC